jgi:hypothetical protein
MLYTDYVEQNDAFIFQFDNVVYPEKDYLLQVYYLFAQFIEYGEHIDAQPILRFMEESYQNEGDKGIFERTAAHFGLPEKYKVNFELLQQNARLPLKLLLFAPVLQTMKEIIRAGKKLFLLADGLPLQQLNKIKQTEWNGVEQFLTVYFTDEIADGSVPHAVESIIVKHEIDASKLVFIGSDVTNQNFELSSKYKFLLIGKLLLP